MDDDAEDAKDSYAEFLRRTKEPEPQKAGDDPTSWRTFGLKILAFFVVAIVILMFFQSDTSQARRERGAWFQTCRGGDHPEVCTPTADEWHDLCFYRRAGGESHFDRLPNRRRVSVKTYKPKEYRKCMDGHARDHIAGLRVDKMLRDKEEAVRRQERKAQ